MQNANSILKNLVPAIQNQLTDEQEYRISLLSNRENANAYEMYLTQKVGLGELILRSNLPDHFLHHKKIECDIFFYLYLQQLAEEREIKSCWDECQHWGVSASDVYSIAFAAGFKFDAKFRYLAKWVIQTLERDGNLENISMSGRTLYGSKIEVKPFMQRLRGVSINKLKFAIRGAQRIALNGKKVNHHFVWPADVRMRDIINVGRVSFNTAMVLLNNYLAGEKGLNYGLYRQWRNWNKERQAQYLPAVQAAWLLGKQDDISVDYHGDTPRINGVKHIVPTTVVRHMDRKFYGMSLRSKMPCGAVRSQVKAHDDATMRLEHYEAVANAQGFIPFCDLSSRAQNLVLYYHDKSPVRRGGRGRS